LAGCADATWTPAHPSHPCTAAAPSPAAAPPIWCARLTIESYWIISVYTQRAEQRTAVPP
jgi:hypothetical protein